MIKYKHRAFFGKLLHPLRTFAILAKELKVRRRADVYLISLPHSGKHWLEFMLAAFLIDHFGPGKQKAVDVWKKGAFRFTLDLRQEKDLNIPIIQHHHFPCYFFFRRSKVVLLVRDLRDSLVSNYDKYLKLNKSSMPFSEFLRKEIGREDAGKWDLKRKVHFLNSWHKYRERTRQLLVVRYEDLLENPERELRKIIFFIGISGFDDSKIRRAVCSGSMGNMGALEKKEIKYRKESGNYVVNRGRAGRYRDYFSQEDLAYFKNYTDKNLLCNFGYDY